MSSTDYTEMNELLHDTWSAWQPWMQEAKKDLEFWLGEHWSSQDTDYLDRQKRPHLVINKNIRRFINLLTGYQRQNKLAISFSPWEGSDALTAQQFSALALHSLEKFGGYHQISRAFAQNVKVGLDWVNLYIDFTEDNESGDIYFKRVPWTKILADPLLQEITLDDCNYLFRREYLTARQLQMLIPGKKIKGKFQTAAQSYGLILDPSQNIMAKDDRYILTELWERDWTHKPFVLDTQSGKKRLVDIQNKKHEERLRFLLQQFPQLRVFRKRVQTQKLRLFIGEDCIWKGNDPSGCGDFPYVPIICYFDPEYSEMKLKLQGIIRQLRDPATELNKRRSQILHIINTMATGGWRWEEGALDDESQMNNASGAGIQIRTKKNKLDRVQQINPPRFPTELVRIEEMFANDPVDITGINAELLAMMNKDMPGISIQLRQQQGLVIIQEIFDNLRIAKKGIGNRYLKAVKNNYSPEKVQRIIGQTPSPQFYTKDFEKYDSVVEEAMSTPTQRSMMFQKLIWIHQNVSPIHPMIMLELADIPEQYRDAQAQFMMQQLGGGPQGPGGGGPPPPGGGGAPPGPPPPQGGPQMKIGK